MSAPSASGGFEASRTCGCMQIGARGPQLLLSAKPEGPHPSHPGSLWSHRKICPGDNVTLVDTADFTVQAVHFAFAALLLLAYHVDCLQCLVTEEEAWRRLSSEAGTRPAACSSPPPLLLRPLRSVHAGALVARRPIGNQPTGAAPVHVWRCGKLELREPKTQHAPTGDDAGT